MKSSIFKLMTDEDQCVFVGSYRACQSRMDYGDYIIQATADEEEEYFGL